MQAFPRRKEYGNLSEFLSQTAQKCLHSEWGYAIINKLILKRPCGQAAKTAPSHGAIPGSIPGKVTRLELSEHHYYRTVGSDSFFIAAKRIGLPYKSRANQFVLIAPQSIYGNYLLKSKQHS